ncbi:hypothetical protein TWF694_011861 [Orbilia ellipsospora]|uniref:Transcription elongation factor Eaf N-terminal domain-containing protein n=1 Tax=Orbilia ellipsospora TaxID=2528407 RepID=A0AAV9X6V6_9PEZI
MATASAVEFNPTRQGKFKVLIGDSIKHTADDAQSSSVYSSFRYNAAPPSGTSKLSQADAGQFNLSYEDEKETAYAGTQRPGRKLECILVYNPKDNSFTLERMTSVFTFNQSHPTSDMASIPTATYDDDPATGAGNSTDDEDAQLADAENPFDIRHFNSRALPNSDEDDDEREETKEEDTDVDMEDVDTHTTAVEPEHEPEIALTPGPASSTPIPASSATPTPNPALPMLKRKPKKPVDPFMKPTRGKPKAPANPANQGRSPLLHPDAALHAKEASMSPQPRLPSPMHLDRKATSRNSRVKEVSSESDADSSDEDSDNDRRRRPPPPTNKHIRSGGMSREPSFTGSILSNNAPDELEFPDPKSEDKGEAAEEEVFDLDRAMLEEFDFSGDEDEVAGGGGDLMIEGEEERRGIGLGINNLNSGVAPVSLSSITGGRGRDESEEESSEEE